MHFFISSIKSGDIVSFPDAFGGRACRSEPCAHLLYFKNIFKIKVLVS